MFSLVDHHPIAGTTWIDCGCGTGTLSQGLAARGCRVTGYDASEEMLRVASKRALDTTIPYAPIFHPIETIEHLPLESATCDGVLCASVLEYTASPANCIAEFSRVLRPNGLLLLSIPNRRSMLRQFFRAAYAVTSQFVRRPAYGYFAHSTFDATVSEISKLLELKGFTQIGHNFAGSSLPHWIDQKDRFGTLINVLARKNAVPNANAPLSP